MSGLLTTGYLYTLGRAANRDVTSITKDDTRSIYGQGQRGSLVIVRGLTNASAAVAKSYNPIHVNVSSARLRPGETNRQRASGDGCVHLDDEEEKVHRKGCIDGKPDLRLVPNVLLDSSTFFIIGAQKLINELVLPGVILLESLFVAFRVVNLHLPLGDILFPVSTEIQWVDGSGDRRGDSPVGVVA